MAFIDYTEANRIVLVVLSPYTTDRLQPLDVGLFSPLAMVYSKHLDIFTFDGLETVSMTKGA